jgi:hypothetical protein
MKTLKQIKSDLKTEFDNQSAKAIRSYWVDSFEISYLYSQYQDRNIYDLDELEMHEMAHYLNRQDLKKQIEALEERNK